MKAQTSVSTGYAASKNTHHAQEKHTASLDANHAAAPYSGSFRKNCIFLNKGRNTEIHRHTPGEPTEWFPLFQINLKSSRKEARQ